MRTAWASLNKYGPYRGFDHMELSAHGAMGPLHYARWLAGKHPKMIANFYPVLDPAMVQNSFGEANAGAVQVKRNATPRALYHTDWVADPTIAYLNSLDDKAEWFVWMSFPDPLPPWDPPEEKMRRHNWKALPGPAGYPGSLEKIDQILSAKPHH